MWFKNLMDRLRHLMGSKREYWLDIYSIEKLRLMAEREKRRPDDLARDLLAHAIADIEEQAENMRLWQSLTPREQQVAALVCLYYTNQQIAERLGLSHHTIREYVHNALEKFEVSNRNELRRRLHGWDFNLWANLDE